LTRTDLNSIESGLGQFVRFYFGQYQDDRILHSNFDPVGQNKEETTVNLLWQESASRCRSTPSRCRTGIGYVF